MGPKSKHHYNIIDDREHKICIGARPHNMLEGFQPKYKYFILKIKLYI